MDILHTSRIAYAIRTTHYFYIKQATEFENDIYTPNVKPLDNLVKLGTQHRNEEFIQRLRKNSHHDNISIFYDETKDHRHVNIRTRNNLSIKDVLSGIIIQHYINPDLPFTEFYTLQLSPAQLYKYTITITLDERIELVENILQDVKALVYTRDGQVERTVGA